MPDTKENQSYYQKPLPKRNTLGFPMARILALISLSCGAVLDLKIGPYSGKGSGEASLFMQLVDSLRSSDVLLMDRLFASFRIMASCIGKKIDFVARNMGARIRFERVKRLGKKDDLVRLHKEALYGPRKPEGYDALPENIVVRRIEYRIKQAGFRAKTIILLTSLIDPKQYPAAEIADLYGMRWNVELDLRSIKSSLGMDVLSCKTPDMVRKEIWTHILTYNLIRTVMAQAALIYNLMPRRLSFKGTATIVNAFRPLLSLCSDTQSWQEYYRLMLEAISSQVVPYRPNRREPRAVRLRTNPYSTLRCSRTEARTLFWKKGAAYSKRKQDMAKTLIA